MVGVRRYGWRRSSRLLVACAGPSNRVVLPSTHCATRALKSVRARVARARQRRRLSQAHPFSSSDAPRDQRATSSDERPTVSFMRINTVHFCTDSVTVHQSAQVVGALKTSAGGHLDGGMSSGPSTESPVFICLD